ncbi:hypothetical protein ACWKW9_09075 [Rhizobium daejeonense]
MTIEQASGPGINQMIRIERVSRIWAPSDSFFPNRSEAERLQATYDTYRIRPTD